MTKFNITNYDIVFTKPLSIQYSACAWTGHIPFAFFIVDLIRPKIFVELGVHNGNSYNAFCQVVKKLNLITKCYGIDTWQGDKHAGHYDTQVFEKLYQHQQQNYASFSSLMKMTFDEALNHFSDGTIDILHIDGCHTYEAVKHDFETWLPKVKESGVIILHDIYEKSGDFGVWKLWDEIKKAYPSVEFSHSHGLGVVFLSYKSGEVRDFVENFKQKSYYEKLFKSLGEHTDNVFYIEQKTQELEQKTQELEQKKEELEQKKEELEQKNQEISLIVNSKTWKMTAPLRAIAYLLRRTIAYFKSIIQKKIIAKQELHNQKLYKIWLKRNALTDEKLKEIKQCMEKFNYKSLISVITPVYNIDEKWLRKCIDSVRNQLYENWELCIADDASTEPHVKEVLKAYELLDQRIKVIYRETNGHISAASNSALKLVKGEYIALLDHDDELTPDALYEIVKLLNERPDSDMIYSDEDKIDEEGNRSYPFFKPDWSPDSFLSQMYTCHLGVYRTSIVKDIGGFREGFEGSQDYDLVLRLTEKTDKIFHVPKVLYHWRAFPHSTAMNASIKDYAGKAAVKALEEALARRGERATVKPLPSNPGCYRVHYIINEKPLISIIIPTRDNNEALGNCLHTIHEKTNYDNYEIIIVDNGSVKQKTFELFNQWQSVLKGRLTVYRLDIPFNYPKLNNEAVNVSSGELILLLNDDTEVITPFWLTDMAAYASKHHVGAVGAKLFYPDNTIQHAGVVLGIKGIAGHSHRGHDFNDDGYYRRLAITSNYSAVTGACLMVKKDLYQAVGGLDESLSIAFNDVDFCLKLHKKGFYNVVLPEVQLYHHESKSRGYENTPEKQARFSKEINIMKQRWGDLLKNDPFYNPNLTLDREDFTIRI